MKQNKKNFKNKKTDNRDRNRPAPDKKPVKTVRELVKKEVVIDKLASTGEGIAKLEGMVYFVSGAVPGDTVQVNVPAQAGEKNYYHAKVDKIISASKHRAKPQCAIFTECGACQWQYMDYPTQLDAKKSIVAEQFKHIGKLDVSSKINDCVGSKNPYGYRSKAQFVAGRSRSGQMVLGYYSEGSHRLISVPTCPVLHPNINKILPDIITILNSLHITAYDEVTHTGSLRHLVIIYSEHEDKFLLGLVVNEHSRLPQKQLTQALTRAIPNLSGIIININSRETNIIYGDKSFTLHGKDHVIEKLGNTLYKRGLTTFFQANNDTADKIFSAIKNNLKEKEAVLDLYCGVGTIGLYMGERAKLIVGLEENPESIKLAVQNAKLNKLSDEKAFFDVFNIERGLPPDIADIEFTSVIVDPPRKGLSKIAIEKVAELAPDNICYVTCNPTTAARDCSIFATLGYDIQSVTPYDMFPQTYHVEGLIILKRRNAR